MGREFCALIGVAYLTAHSLGLLASEGCRIIYTAFSFLVVMVLCNKCHSKQYFRVWMPFLWESKQTMSSWCKTLRAVRPPEVLICFKKHGVQEGKGKVNACCVWLLLPCLEWTWRCLELKQWPCVVLRGSSSKGSGQQMAGWSDGAGGAWEWQPPFPANKPREGTCPLQHSDRDGDRDDHEQE